MIYLRIDFRSIGLSVNLSPFVLRYLKGDGNILSLVGS